MFRIDARKIVLAFSLLAAVGAMLPGSHAASAAPITAPDAASNLQVLHAEQAPPKPVATFNKMSMALAGETHSGKLTQYHFRIKADAGTLPNVTVELSSRIRSSLDDSYWGTTAPITQSLGTISAPDTKFVTIMCDPPTNQYCGGAVAVARSSNGQQVVIENEADGFKN